MFSKSKPMQGSILVFDVNETLLDVKALRPHFERLFKDGAVLKEWFALVLLYSQTVTQAGDYADFGNLARVALQMVAEIHQVPLTEDDIAGLARDMRSLPPHPDVLPGLQLLHKEHFYVVALTNSTEEGAEQQIKHAGVEDLFERIFSVDAVAKFKPAPRNLQICCGQTRCEDIRAHDDRRASLGSDRSQSCRMRDRVHPETRYGMVPAHAEASAETVAELANQLIARQQLQ